MVFVFFFPSPSPLQGRAVESPARGSNVRFQFATVCVFCCSALVSRAIRSFAAAILVFRVVE